MTENQKQLYDMLNKYSGKRVTLSEIAKMLGISQQSINQHLRAMEKKGVIRRQLPVVCLPVK